MNTPASSKISSPQKAPTTPTPTILFAGGGTGGHIYPALAVAERLADHDVTVESHFAVSDRAIDASILNEADLPYTPLTVRPLPRRPWHVLRFIGCYYQSKAAARKLMTEGNVVAVVSMGGFVSGPVVAAASAMSIPTVLVNLDAVPGKANRFLANRCDRVLSVYPSAALPADTQPIAMPLRRSALAPAGEDPQAIARKQLGLDPQKNVLLITGASQGATSINLAMAELAARSEFLDLFADWQILHLAGKGPTDDLQKAYDAAALPAKVIEFSHEMGLVWSSATLAVSRAGAGSVAEVLANAVPTLFLPYPYHKDQHQKLNAQPLVDAGAAMMLEDVIDPKPNADALLNEFVTLLGAPESISAMRSNLIALQSGDGAEQVAQQALKLASLIE